MAVYTWGRVRNWRTRIVPRERPASRTTAFVPNVARRLPADSSPGKSLRIQVRTTARVLRDGQQSVIDAEELVPGDIILLDPGAHVPADARLAEAIALRVEEAALTGESVPVGKSCFPLNTRATSQGCDGVQWERWSTSTSWPSLRRCLASERAKW